jgi:hypothetical protein
MSSAASNAWPRSETDPQRRALLAAADRLLAGTPRHATGRLSVVQLAIEARVKYWIVAQKHTDLRDHFQRLAAESIRKASDRSISDPHEKLIQERDELRQHCQHLEQLVDLYATAVNELALENRALREQSSGQPGTSTLLPFRPGHHQQH